MKLHPTFATDPYPNGLKVLFVAYGSSSHTIDWMNLLEESGINTRLFAIPHSAPPLEWPGKAYITGLGAGEDTPASATRFRMYPRHRTPPLPKRIINHASRRLGHKPEIDKSPEQYLVEILQDWQPDIVQSLGFFYGGFFFDACQQMGYDYPGVVMSMIWGTPDIQLQSQHPQRGPQRAAMIARSDYVFSDTEQCIDFARSLGLRDSQIPEYYIFPGAGGVDVDALASLWVNHPPSTRRTLMWPKTYNNYYVSPLSVLEALRLCWDDIQPCELLIPNMTPDIEQWYHALPTQMKAASRTPDHMPHAQFQQLMAQTRVMLAPSLMDGMPNVLVDAMACGAFPIMSPLGGLTPILTDEENTLFARNLYPQEIATAITRAMTDNALVDAAAQRNLELVRHIASRPEIRRQVLHIYQEAARTGRTDRQPTGS